MNASKRTLIKHTLRNLAESQAKTIELMEQTLTLLGEELAIDAISFWKSRTAVITSPQSGDFLMIDHNRLQVVFRGRSCVLGNTLPFKLLARLARRPNTYVTYDELLSEVWEGVRSEAAVRSVVKRLRQALRREGMADLAEAIDGTEAGRYCLRVDS